MRSSIFNFDGLRRLGRQLGQKRRAVALTALALGAAYAGSLALLGAVFDGPNFQTKAVAALSEKTETLFLGSSRVFYGVDPALLSRPSMNLAAVYLDLASAADLLEAYGPRLTGLRAVTVELGVVTLCYDTRFVSPDGLERLGLPVRPGLADFRERFDWSVHRLFAPFFRWRLTPLFFKEAEQLTGLGKESLTERAGYVPSDLHVAFPELVAKAKLEQAQQQIGACVRRDANLAGLARLRDLAAGRGLKLILVRYPKEPSQRAVFPPAWQELIAGARQRFPELPFWDFSNDTAFVSEDFRDPDHLNRRGAARLAPLLDARLRLALK